jgi:hypothetical protein
MTWSFLVIQAPVVIMLSFAVVFCLYRSNWVGSARLDGSGRKALYQRLSLFDPASASALAPEGEKRI